MNVRAAVLVLVTCWMSAFAAEVPTCSSSSPWDDTRKSLAQNERDPGFLPIASIDGGNLLRAMNDWFAARAAGDAQRLREMIIPLGMQYDAATRAWVQMALTGYRYDVARPLLAQVDPSNPGLVLVLSEVTIRIGGKCSMSAMGCSWLKVNGKWMVLPDGPRLVG